MIKLRKTVLISFIILTLLTIGIVSASDNNATNEVIKLENKENIDNLNVEASDNDILGQQNEDSKLQASINNDTTESTILSAISTNESSILSVSTAESSDNIILKSAKKISATTTIKFKKSAHYPVKKSLKTKDTLYSIYPTNPNGQYGSGITLEITYKERSGYAIHTKVKKVKFYYKNLKTGKYKIRTVTKIKNGNIYISVKSPLYKGYKPIKAKVWYTSR